MSALRQEIGIDEVMRSLAEIKATLAALQQDNRPEYYSIRQVAEHHGKSVRTIQRYISEGKLPVTERFGERMVHRDDV